MAFSLSVLMWQLRPFSIPKQILSMVQFFVEILRHNATTLDVTSHCLCADDAIYHVFVSHNLGSLSAMRDYEELNCYTVCSYGGHSGCVNGRDVDFNCG